MKKQPEKKPRLTVTLHCEDCGAEYIQDGQEFCTECGGFMTDEPDEFFTEDEAEEEI